MFDFFQPLRDAFLPSKKYQRWDKFYLFGKIPVMGKIGRVTLTTELCVVYGLIAD